MIVAIKAKSIISYSPCLLVPERRIPQSPQVPLHSCARKEAVCYSHEAKKLSVLIKDDMQPSYQVASTLFECQPCILAPERGYKPSHKR